MSHGSLFIYNLTAIGPFRIMFYFLFETGTVLVPNLEFHSIVISIKEYGSCECFLSNYDLPESKYKGVSLLRNQAEPEQCFDLDPFGGHRTNQRD